MIQSCGPTPFIHFVYRQGGAIVAAQNAALSLESSFFTGNFGKDSYAIVVRLGTFRGQISRSS